MLPNSFTHVARVALFLAGANTLNAQQPLPASMTRRIDSVFAAYDNRTSPGCAVAVVRDSKTVFEKGYGMSDFQHAVPITPTSIFHVASISKQFTAMAIVLLAQDGKLSLDDDIRKHLPEVPDFGRLITIRHLIHHTSGLRDQWSLLAMSGWRPDDPKSQADILWLVSKQRALNFDPGAEHLYSNTGYTLLAVIVQRVSGRTFREFTTERIFAPLGMTSTHFHDDHAMIVPGRTSAYVPRGNSGRGGAALRVEDYAISIPVFDNAGATSLFTTVQDMAKWDANFLSPKVGDARTIEQMQQRGKLKDGTEIPYAFALSHGRLRGLPTIGHDGADAGYRAAYIRFPEQRSAFVTLCNLANSNPNVLNRDVASIVLGDLMAPIAAPSANTAQAVTEVPIDPQVLRGFAGIYLDRATESVADPVFRDSTKSLHAGSAPNAPRPVHVGNNEFVLPQQGTPGMRYRFGTNTLSNGTTTMERVAPAVPARAALAEFAGTYYSDELDVEWKVTVARDSVLAIARRRTTPDQPIRIVYADGFTGGVGSVRFTRNREGRVDGFLLTAGRIRHIRFERR